MSSDPAIITNIHWARVLDVVTARLNFCLVRGGEDADEGTEHNTIADSDDSAIQYDGAMNMVRRKGRHTN